MNDDTHEALKVSESLEAEIQRALQHQLTDADIERARLTLGWDQPARTQELYTVASPDAIRNWAHGVGDDNPLYTDESYGPKTRWGSQIAHGTMAGFIKTPLLGERLPEEVRAANRGLFRGVHVFVSGGTWEWFRPIYPGDRIFSFNGEESIEEKTSEFAERSVIRVRRDVAINQRAEVIGVYRIVRVLTERKKSRTNAKYAEIEPACYTDEDYTKFDALYAAEGPRGAEKRFWEDVAVGDVLDPMLKGPFTVTDVQVFHMGGYGMVPYGLKSNRLGFKNRRRIPTFYVKNEHGVYDVAQRVHWDSEWAKGIGNPMAYDYGVMRQGFFYHHVSDWAGDDAAIIRLEDSIRRFNYVGDTQFLSGTVAGKRQQAGQHVVDLDLRMTNQRDVETAYGAATVALPTRDERLPRFPEVPAELADKAIQMLARHNRLLHER